MAKFLIQCGADITKVTHRGYTALDFASEMLNIDVMQIFVEAQVSVDCAADICSKVIAKHIIHHVTTLKTFM